MFVYQVCEWNMIDWRYVDISLYKNLSDAISKCRELYNELYPKMERMKLINYEVTDGYGIKYRDESYFPNFRFKQIDQTEQHVIVGYGICDKVDVTIKNKDGKITKEESVDNNYIICCVKKLEVIE